MVRMQNGHVRDESAGGIRGAGSGGGDVFARSALGSQGLPGGFQTGDSVVYIGPDFTFPQTGVRLVRGLPGQVVGVGTNVPTEYQTHAFLGIQFAGFDSMTNVPPEAVVLSRDSSDLPQTIVPRLAQGRPPAAAARPRAVDATPAGPPSDVEQVWAAHHAAQHLRQERHEECCVGPRNSCDVLSFFDALFGVEEPAAPAARSARSAATFGPSSAQGPGINFGPAPYRGSPRAVR